MNILEEIDFKYLIEVDTNPLIFLHEGENSISNSSAESYGLCKLTKRF